ncbi:MAG: phage/plasmid primase, P4 family [Pseudomonadota bacterium]
MSRGEDESTPGPGTDAGGAVRHAHEDQPNADKVAEGASRGEAEGLVPNYDMAVGFLEAWRPGGPWVLTAIEVDGGKDAPTPTSTLGTADEVRRWIKDHSGGRWNLYFTPNVTRGPVRKKPKKLDMVEAVALFCDVDPRAREPLDPERARIARLFDEWSKDGRPLQFPRPSVVIDSGGGMQGFFILREPIPLDSADTVADVEARAAAIKVAVGGDGVQNVDRVMRLVGTVNWPSEKKRKRGRVPRLARIVEAHWDRRCDLDDFPAPQVPTPPSAVRDYTAAADVDLSALELPDRVMALIKNGGDPDDPAKWEDRSDLVLHVLCEMIRADLPDDVLLGVILDPKLGVSAHVLEQKPDPEKYARRQVQRALERQPRPGPILHGGAMDWARAVRDAGRPRLLHHQQEFLDWDGAAYVNVDDLTVRAEAWTFLETCRVKPKEGETRPFNPTSGAIHTTVDALKAVTHLAPSREEPPRWLDRRSGPDPLDLLPTRSGLLHLPTGDLMPATPALFTRNALDFSHEPDAPEPSRWLRFLAEVWPGSDEADCITALQEFMGYLLTPDTSLQKALLIPGPKRSGKGTIGRIMGKLVGEANTVAPSLNSFGRSDFGLEPLLAKQLAIVSDMRLSGRTDEAAVAENLLRITGEDRVSVNRKYKRAVEVTLRARFVLMTNEVPRFADKSGALVSRFIVLPMRESFFGREDTGLTGALLAELPGILNWAVEGWRRVRATKRITQPQAGSGVALQMGDLSSPIPAFVREWCVTGPDEWVAKGRLFSAFREWHRTAMGQDYLSNSAVFARDLYSAMDGQVKDSKSRKGQRRMPGFGGIALRPGFGAGSRNDATPF